VTSGASGASSTAAARGSASRNVDVAVPPIAVTPIALAAVTIASAHASAANPLARRNFVAIGRWIASAVFAPLLDRLNEDDTCVLTAEDPVESRIVGVTQVHCDEGAGVSFASALRSFLRQDPDVVMVGEIRDAETADISLKAALTRHLVLSTLHTNDAPGAVLRLINMNLEPFMIASALRLVVAQRLIRRLCAKCKTAVPANSDKLRVLLKALPPESVKMLKGSTIYEPAGCPDCGGSGYRGRTGIFEVLRVSERTEELIVARASAVAIRAQARADGMRTLRESGLRKIALGETSIAEVLEHTIADTEDSLPSAVKAVS
jgi:type II secretory ATPase GspE/PulE/Tfp pilus assembly ATPase PilB-like protein